MLTITRDQTDMLSQTRVAAFVEEMRAHLAAHFPQLAPGPPAHEDEIRARIRAALATAADHGLASRRDGCRFLNLAACFGWDFIARADCSWMAEMLQDDALGSPSARLQRLSEEAMARLERGADDERARAVFDPPARKAARPWMDADFPEPDQWGDDAVIDTPDGLS